MWLCVRTQHVSCVDVFAANRVHIWGALLWGCSLWT